MTLDEIEQWHKDNPHTDRSDEYMDAVLAEVKKLWQTGRSQRLGQLLTNNAPCYGVFYALDEDWF